MQIAIKNNKSNIPGQYIFLHLIISFKCVCNTNEYTFILQLKYNEVFFMFLLYDNVWLAHNQIHWIVVVTMYRVLFFCYEITVLL